MNKLAEELDRSKDTPAAARVRELLDRPSAPDGPTRIVPLPEVVMPRTPDKPGAGLSSKGASSTAPARNSLEPWPAGVREIRSQAASGLFQLAQRAAKSNPPRFALGSICLRAVLEREPEHPEARRILGYVPYQGGWARPFAVRQLQAGCVSHATCGWVHADWIAHLDRGELPAPSARGQKKVRWLPAAVADQLRAGWNPPWRISTEHFEVHTDVPFAEAISFGRRLEAFYDLFTTLLADILGENLPLVRRFRDPKMAGEPEYRTHLVYYFASKQEYVAYFQNKPDRPDLENSLGYYHPPKSSGHRVPAFFFRDPNGELPVTANLYHEVSHQLLFETAGPNAYTRNRGNYWVFEGLGTYFETVSQKPDGALEVGALVGPRMEAAKKALVDQGRGIPLTEFVALEKSAFDRTDSKVYLYYQQAMALTVFLMQWHSAFYRDAFLDYVQDAYHGYIKRNTGRSLQDRLGVPYATLDNQLLAFLRGGTARSGAQPPMKKPSARGAIRTVPRP